MPTASTSQILGYNECFEPVTSNMYSRRVLSGEFQVVNPYLLRDLVDLGIWDEGMKQHIITQNGSIQNLPNIPQELKDLYKTVWEISQKTIINMAADRSVYIDQSHSLNLFLQAPTMGKITSMHFYGWKKGLKTGMYYLRTQAASAAIQFTIDQSVAQQAANNIADLSNLKRPSYVESEPSYVPSDFKADWENIKPSKITYSETEDESRNVSLTPSASSSNDDLSSSVGSLKISEHPATPVSSTTTNIPVKEDKKEVAPEAEDAESEFDIYNSKVIACAIDKPEACEMCSG